VGTGKTHLLAAIHHAVTEPAGEHTAVPAAFVHSSALFRATATPEAYAREIAEHARLLLIDEVELDDPAAEVRLIGVLRTLRRLGVVVAATSNVEPDRFISSTIGTGRLDRFVSEDFRRSYHVVLVGGDDYRLRSRRPGKAFIGAGADDRLRDEAAGAIDGSRAYFRFADLMARATDVERMALAAELAQLDTLYIEGITIGGTDDALRLLRLVDDLYAAPDAPVLLLSAANAPSEWFPPSRQPAGLARAVAEKFERTVSRIEGLVETIDLGQST
jgi:cell division protein ZapE